MQLRNERRGHIAGRSVRVKIHSLLRQHKKRKNNAVLSRHAQDSSGTASSSHGFDFRGLSGQEDLLLQKLDAYWQWAQEDPRVAVRTQEKLQQRPLRSYLYSQYYLDTLCRLLHSNGGSGRF
jgi:hypothetical protein